MKATPRTLLLGLFKPLPDDPRARRVSMGGFVVSAAAGHLIAWALGLPFVFAWAFALPVACLLHGVWLWRVSRPAS